MRKSILLSLAAAALCCANASAEIPLGYYSSLDGKCGAELKNAIHALVTDATMLSYGSGDGHTWWGFYETDYAEVDGERQVVDRYSNEIHTFGSRGASVGGMNIEHSFPKSWWGGTANNAYKDLFNLMPCEKSINSSKSNYGMGVVTNATTDNGCTKVGQGDQGFKVWEPADKWKGDFARGYMYMATAYQDFTWTGQALNSLTQGDYPTLKEWASTLYIKWAKQDAVDEIETTRNDAVYAIQGNRNPYVDFPNLMEYVWGDSVSTPLNIRTTVKAGGSSADGPATLYDETFLGNDGGCVASGSSRVWTVTDNYGWKGAGFIGGACTQTDASLTTPEIDLSGCTKAEMTFSHAANQFKDAKPEVYCSVEIIVDGAAPEALDIPKWPAGTNWTFISSGKTDLNAYCGHKVKIVFHYTSDTSVAGTWEIKSLKVTGTISAGIDSAVSAEDAVEVARYDLYGRLLSTPAAGINIVVMSDGTVRKEIIR